MSTFTASKNLEQVARGGDLGTWDSPENSNWAIVDAALGQAAAIALNNSNVVLSTPQYQCNFITFNSTLSGSVSITFPTSFTGPYSISNVCTGSSAFTITLTTTAAGGKVIACPAGEIFDIFNDGVNLSFRNLGRVGSYMDLGCSAVPGWISGCSVPPYLNCDGSTFTAATYPALAAILGSNVLPDSRGRSRFALNQGTGRLNSVIVDTLGSGGGDQFLQAHIHNVNGTTGAESAAHNHGYVAPNANTTTGGGGFPCGGPVGNFVTGNENQNHTHSFNVNSANAGGGNGQNVPPAYMGGLTLIRAG